MEKGVQPPIKVGRSAGGYAARFNALCAFYAAAPPGFLRQIVAKNPLSLVRNGGPMLLLALLRDGGLCRACGRRGGAVHHRNCNRQDNRLRNLATLCRACHLAAHGMGIGSRRSAATKAAVGRWARNRWRCMSPSKRKVAIGHLAAARAEKKRRATHANRA